jgi:hypothetical protein
MTELIVGACIAIILPAACMWFYRRGVKDGQNIKKDIPLEPIVKPTKERKEEKEAQEQQDTLDEKLEAVLSFDPNKAFKGRR